MTNDIYRMGLDLWTRWTEMWNRDPSLARELVAPVFTLHLTLPSRAEQTEITTPEAVHEWVAQHCARFDRLVFSTEVGPFVDTVRGVVAGPWNADTIVAGKPQPVCGMDTIAFRDRRITEYWTISKPVDAFGRWASAPGK